MDPQAQFCHNPACAASGQVGQGNIVVHSRKERRYKCETCGRTFAASKDTPLYRRHKSVELYPLVVTLVCHGCPPQAVVAAFGLDERTVWDWVAKAGAHCQQVHEHVVAGGQVELGCVQADELWVKMVGKRVWMALALCVPSRLWLGGVVSGQRDKRLVGTLARLVRACAERTSVLVCTDGFASYLGAFRRAWRRPEHTGRRGRPRLVAEPGLLLAQAVKQYVQKRVVGVRGRVAQGAPHAVAAALAATGAGARINTAYIERLNATFRARLVPLVRRTRALARKETVLSAGMWLVGTTYNFCWPHQSLRLVAGAGAPHHWCARTPAMAAGLTDHPWSVEELLRYQVPPPVGRTPQGQRRPPKRVLEPPLKLAA